MVAETHGMTRRKKLEERMRKRKSTENQSILTIRKLGKSWNSGEIWGVWQKGHKGISSVNCCREKKVRNQKEVLKKWSKTLKFRPKVAKITKKPIFSQCFQINFFPELTTFFLMHWREKPREKVIKIKGKEQKWGKNKKKLTYGPFFTNISIEVDE